MTLFSPLTVGALELPNRVVMAPLTRLRSSATGVPSPMNVEYYTQRSTTGFIMSEGIYTSPGSQAYPGQPGLVTPEQIAGWRLVTDAVHTAGGRIFAQLMHGGRVTHPDVNGGNIVTAPSPIAIAGEVRTQNGKQNFPVPTAPTEAEMSGLVGELVKAAQNAIEAGFDGVEVHSANGYLLHEFLSPVSNVRTDSYGSSPANRARLGIEVVTAISAAIGADRVGIRISPSHNIQDVLELDADETRLTYEALIDGIAPLSIAYLSALHAEPTGDLIQGLRTRFGGVFIANSGFGTVTTHAEAEALIADGFADAVAVGRLLIANPDLVRRWAEGTELNQPDAASFYGPDERGYTDYPALEDAVAA